MEHCSDTDESVNPDPTVPSIVFISSLAKRIEVKIDRLPPLFPDESCIYRVHQGLRSVNPEAYTPLAISIGPYHHGKKELYAMEEHKLRCLRSFLKRREGNNMEMYLSMLAKFEDRARKFYADPIDLKPEEFVEMMLLDGCFIIEFLRKKNFECVEYAIIRDMILLENQLPYFVLTQLYEINKDSNDIPLIHMTQQVFEWYLSPNQTSRFGGSNDTPEIKHLLHLVQLVLCSPLSVETSVVRDIRSSALRWPCCFLSKWKSIARNIKSSVLCCPSFKPTSSDSKYNIRSAVELRDAGVKFKKVDGGLFYIKFDDGLMELPYFSVDDSSETILRNLVAYEQHSVDGEPKYFTDYINFMDQIINSEKDVNLLRLNGIMDNCLGDDQEVCKLFNSLGNGVIYNGTGSHYSKVYDKVKKHCQIPWNQKKAKLRHNYFNSPWAGISTVAACVLLLLTLLQTIAAFTKK